jgi:MFS family permease
MASPKRSSALVEQSPVYYGWVVLTVATLGIAATLPGQTAGISLFIDAFIKDLVLSRSVVSWLYTGATVLGSLGLPLAGRLLDRYGPRRVAVVLIALLAASCAGMRWVSGWVGVFVGFVRLRGVGQGALGLVLALAAFVGWAMDWDAGVVVTGRGSTGEGESGGQR